MHAVEATAPMPARHNRIFLIVFFAVHAIGILAIILHRSWSALGVLAVTHMIFGWIGISLCYHRLLAHGSFRVPVWLERILVTIGAMAVQGGPITWVGTHKRHHANSDKPDDPHSPVERGFLWSHLGWMLWGGQRDQRFRTVDKLASVRYYRFLEAGQLLFQVPLGLFLYWLGGWEFVAYGIFLRLLTTWHITFCINSVCHLWGSRRYATSDNSKNNWLVNIFAGGEGLHNNHHSHPKAATTARRWWHFDPTGWMIYVLSYVGLASDVAPPREAIDNPS